MPKIKLLKDCKFGQDGQILEKPKEWILHYTRLLGEDFDLIDEKTEPLKIAASGETIELAYMKLSEGDKDSVKKGFRKLVLRKAGWVLVDCINKALTEIHVSVVDRSAQIKDAKDSAKARAAEDLKMLVFFKEILLRIFKNAVSGVGNEGYEDFDVTGEDLDIERIEGLVKLLSIGNSEVETLKSEVERMNKILKTR